MNLQQPDADTVAKILARSNARVVPGIINKEPATEARDIEANKNGLVGKRWKQNPNTQKRQIVTMRRAEIMVLVGEKASEENPISTRTIAKALKRDTTTINEDLRSLRDSGVVLFRREGFAFVYWPAK